MRLGDEPFQGDEAVALSTKRSMYIVASCNRIRTNWRRAVHIRHSTLLLLAPWFVGCRGFVCNWPIPILHCPCQPLFASSHPKPEEASLVCRLPLRSKESSVSDQDSLLNVTAMLRFLLPRDWHLQLLSRKTESSMLGTGRRRHVGATV